MACIVYKEHGLFLLLVILVNLFIALIDGYLYIHIVGIFEDLDLILGELKSFETGFDYLNVLHGLLDVAKSFFTFDLAQLFVLTAANDDGFLDIGMVK